jgi:hypothetical protein
MTFEQGAIVVIGVLFSALSVVVRILWERSNACEKDRLELRLAIEEAKEQRGELRGQMTAFARCPHDECPFRDDPPIAAIQAARS